MQRRQHSFWREATCGSNNVSTVLIAFFASTDTLDAAQPSVSGGEVRCPGGTQHESHDDHVCNSDFEAPEVPEHNGSRATGYGVTGLRDAGGDALPGTSSPVGVTLECTVSAFGKHDGS